MHRLVMTFLLVLTASCGYSDDSDELFAAVNQGNLKTLSDKLASVASVNTRDRYGKPLVLHAAAMNDPALMRILLKYRPDLTWRNKTDGHSVLHEAVMNQNMEILRMLLEAGAPMHLRDNQGQTPFLYASYYGRQDALKILVDRGVDIRESEDAGNNALILACIYPSADTTGVVKYLVEAGLDVNVVSKQGYSPLILAIAAEKTDAALTLIAAGADPNMADKDGNTPLHEAARSGNEKVLKALILKKPNLNPRLGYGYGEKTPLEEALFWKQTECALLLMNAGADPDCLSTAIFAEMPDIALLLIEKGAQVNVDKTWTQTPLMLASASGYTRVVRAMLETGADPEQTGEALKIKGLRAIDLAWAMDFAEIVELLEQKGSRLNEKVALEYKEKLNKPWMER